MVFIQGIMLKLKDEEYVVNKRKSIRTHWIALCVNGDNSTYFDRFGADRISKIKELIGNKNITTNIYRKQANNSDMCWYLCIRFIDLMLKGKRFYNCTNLFYPDEYEKNEKIIVKYFQ